MTHRFIFNCSQGVYTWFHLYGRKRESVEKFKNVKKWNARSVFGTEVEDELKAVIRKRMGGWNGSSSGKADNQKAFGQYQAELSRLWNGTTEDDKERLGKVAELWNQMGPPPKQQARYEKKKIYQVIHHNLMVHTPPLGMPTRLTSISGHFANK